VLTAGFKPAPFGFWLSHASISLLAEPISLWTCSEMRYMPISIEILVSIVCRVFVHGDGLALIRPEKHDFFAAGFAFHGCSFMMAERGGFEPPDPLGSTVFRTAAIGLSATVPIM
jgi:hypothetical protein